jgi:hypothetical protein
MFLYQMLIDKGVLDKAEILAAFDRARVALTENKLLSEELARVRNEFFE